MKRIKKIFFRVIVPGFLLLNIVAFNHAWQFTHFSAAEKSRTRDPEDLGIGDKIKTLFVGIDNPRPTNQTPTEAFSPMFIPSREEMKMEAWLMEQKTDSARGIVLLFHGYAGHKSSLMPQANAFREMGYHAVLVDFLGHGGSEGNDTSIGHGEAEDVRAAVSYIRAQYPSLPVYLYGFSMGSAAIIRALAIYDDLPIAKAIVAAPFASMLKTVRNRFSLMGMPSWPFAEILVFWGGVQHGFWGFSHNPEKYAKKIKAPVLIMQGTKDRRAKVQDVRKIYENLAGPKELKVFEELTHRSYVDIDPAGWKEIVGGWIDG